MDANLKALIGEIAGILGTNPPELVAALTSEDKLKSASEIKSSLKPLVDQKFEGLVAADKVEQARGRGRREALEEVEKKVEKTFNITGRIEDGLFTTIKESFDGKKTATPEELTKLKNDHRVELKRVKLEHAKEIKTLERENLSNNLFGLVMSELTSDKNNFVLPESESILKSQAGIIVDKFMNYQYEDGKPIKITLDKQDIRVTDEDGLEILDAQKNPITGFGLIKEITVNGHFPIAKAPGRPTPTTKPGRQPAAGKTVKLGDDKELTIPSFANRQELNSFMQGEEGQKLSPQERNAIREEYKGEFDKPE